MKIIVSAGGTGGHIYPAVAIIKKLQERHSNLEVLYIGTTDRMEKDIIPKLGFNFIGIELKGINRKNVFGNIKTIKMFFKAKKEASKIIKEFNPDVVLGIGGYITAPVIIAAKKLNYKTFIHEQNSIPGLSNKILKRYADVIGVSLKDTLKYFKNNKVVFTGNPRAEETYLAKPLVKSKYKLTESKKLVLVVMGSLGSQSVNKFMKGLISKFKDKSYEVLFITGKNYFAMYNSLEIPKNVKIFDSINDMPSVLKKTDLIITRAGASTIAEITAIGIPAIMIPSPYVTHNHQLKNAKVLERENACILIEEKDLEYKSLLNTVDLLLTDEKLITEMKKNSRKLGVIDSATKIAEIIEHLINGDINE